MYEVCSGAAVDKATMARAKDQAGARARDEARAANAEVARAAYEE